MHRRILALCLLLALVLLPTLSGCAVPAAEPETPPSPAPAVPEPEPAPEPEPVPEPEPLPEPCPFTDGPALSVEGADAGYIQLRDGAYYLSLAALTDHAALDAAPVDDGGLVLTLRSRTVWLTGGTLHWESDGTLVTHTTPAVEWDGQWYLPQDVLTPGLGLTVLTDLQYPHVYVSDNGQYEPIPAGICVPTLMYHGIAEYPRGNDELFVTPAALEAQLQYLAENGYTTVTCEDFPSLENIEKPVMLTFDDGYDDNYTYLFPLLQQYGMKATIFVISGYVNFTYYLTEAQIKEMADSGLVSIQSHTNSHPMLDTLDAETLHHELEISWLTLTRITGRVPFALCYPSGRQNEAVRQEAARRYCWGLLMGEGDYITGTEPFLLRRHYVSRDTDLHSFAAQIAHAGQTG